MALQRMRQGLNERTPTVRESQKSGFAFPCERVFSNSNLLFIHSFTGVKMNLLLKKY
jgi:hypothetical protein